MRILRHAASLVAARPQPPAGCYRQMLGRAPARQDGAGHAEARCKQGTMKTKSGDLNRFPTYLTVESQYKGQYWELCKKW